MFHLIYRGLLVALTMITPALTLPASPPRVCHVCGLRAKPDAPGSALAPMSLQTVAVVGGEPDDITRDGQGRLVWGDLARGTVERLDGDHVTVLARGLDVPEGIVVTTGGALVVAEQGRDRLLRIVDGRITVLYRLTAVAGQEGVDGLGRDPRTGELLVPDSPRGTVLRVSADGRRARVIARGLGRPVDAALDGQGDVLVPDENLGTLVVITPRGTPARLGALPTPDDVAVDANGRVWITTLGDGGLWTIDRGGATPRRVLYGLANPQGLTLDRCGNPIIVEQNLARIDRLLVASAAARCLG